MAVCMAFDPKIRSQRTPSQRHEPSSSLCSVLGCERNSSLRESNILSASGCDFNVVVIGKKVPDGVAYFSPKRRRCIAGSLATDE